MEKMIPTVQVCVIENKIVSPITVGVDITLCLASHGGVNIDLMHEAPTISCCELQSLFDFLGDRGFDLSKIKIHTGNMVEKSDQVEIIHRPDFMYELKDYQTLAKKQKFPPKKIQWHFGNMVSRCSLPRLLIASYLFDLYESKTWQTFHWQHNHDYHKVHISFNELLYLFGPTSDEAWHAWRLLQKTPLLKEPLRPYPILYRSESDIIESCQWHQLFFVDIICENRHDDRNFFLTEKFWRAVITRTPFILHGSQWMLENLRKLGFQTFDRWWDEGYSQDPGLHRINEIKKVIDHLAGKSVQEITAMYHDMELVLEHNFQTMLNLDFDDLRSVVWPGDIS